MEFLAKLETLINNLLFQIGNLFIGGLRRLCPPPVVRIWQKFNSWINFLIDNFKNLPQLLKILAVSTFKKLKEQIAVIDFKAKLAETQELAKKQYKSSTSKGASAAKTFFLTPFLVLAQWLQGLNTAQSTMLLFFSAASILSVISIVSSGQRIMGGMDSKPNREPASVEDELKYDRPDYYKKDSRYVDFTNLRLPVYFPAINEIRTVDIDFNVTLSNRQSRMALGKLEFQLRDHLILHTEPVAASFNIEEEGKAVIREKLWREIDQFLKDRKIDGTVVDLNIIYILAN